VIIKCSQNRGEIEFSEKEGLRRSDGSEYFRVTIRSQHMWAYTQVYVYDAFDYDLPRFFGELAENWKGFAGERVWTSLEGEFKIVCTSDSLGHFALKSIIENDMETCSINTIYVEAGQLEEIASEVEKFFDVSDHD
jgi:hypothetical protein